MRAGRATTAPTIHALRAEIQRTANGIRCVTVARVETGGGEGVGCGGNNFSYSLGLRIVFHRFLLLLEAAHHHHPHYHHHHHHHHHHQHHHCRPSFDGTFIQAQEATFVLQCQADAGFFSMLVLGSYTPPIPHDADIGYLKYALESIFAVGQVTITVADTDRDGSEANICGPNSVVSTNIQFDSYVGDRPPIFVTGSASHTRQWPSGVTSLSLGTCCWR